MLVLLNFLFTRNLELTTRNYFMASIAAAQIGATLAALSRPSAVALAKIGVSPQRQFAPVFPPHFCQRDGAPRSSRRFFAL